MNGGDLFSYLQGDASVVFGRRGHAVLPVTVAGEGDQVVVAVAVGDQRGGAVRLQEVQRYGLRSDLGAVLWADDDRGHLPNTRPVFVSATGQQRADLTKQVSVGLSLLRVVRNFHFHLNLG